MHTVYERFSPAHISPSLLPSPSPSLLPFTIPSLPSPLHPSLPPSPPLLPPLPSLPPSLPPLLPEFVAGEIIHSLIGFFNTGEQEDLIVLGIEASFRSDIQ